MDAALRARIREVPDYPLPGVSFKDVSPLLEDPETLRESVRRLVAWARPHGPGFVVGCEARGFTVGSALAYELGCGFVAARRPGKLPGESTRADYTLEYGTNALELQADAIPRNARVIIHDDVLALGGTAGAVAGLVASLGAIVVGFAFLVEIKSLGGRDRLGADVYSLIEF